MRLHRIPREIISNFVPSLSRPSIRATFDRRRTVIPKATPEGLDDNFAEDHEKQHQWAAFVRREPLLITEPSLKKTTEEIREFALPPLTAAASVSAFDVRWSDGGPWIPTG